MNLPSIFKSAPTMKASNNAQKNDKFQINVPQDMFGLGIQVFKIQSRKQILTNTKSVGKARQQIKIIQNPKKVSNIPIIPKPKKISAILPIINKTPSQKQYKIQTITKSDSIFSKKSIQKQTKNQPKIDPIQQYTNKQPIHRTTNLNSNIQKNKTFATSRSANKSMQASPQQQDLIQYGKTINKQEWRKSLNTLRKFYTQFNEYKVNQQSKIGRRKNQQYIEQDQNFIQAYINKNQSNFYQDEQIYDPFSIENYKIISTKCYFQDHKYEQYIIN